MLNLADVLGILEKLPTWNKSSQASETAALDQQPGELGELSQASQGSLTSHDRTQAPDPADILALIEEVQNEALVDTRDDAGREIRTEPTSPS